MEFFVRTCKYSCILNFLSEFARIAQRFAIGIISLLIVVTMVLFFGRSASSHLNQKYSYLNGCPKVIETYQSLQQSAGNEEVFFVVEGKKTIEKFWKSAWLNCNKIIVAG